MKAMKTLELFFATLEMSGIDKMGLVGEYMSILEPQEILKILIVNGEIKKIFVDSRWWDILTCGYLRTFMTSQVVVYELQSFPAVGEDISTPLRKHRPPDRPTALTTTQRKLHQWCKMYGADLKWISMQESIEF
jgi:hypothetical protein